MNPLPFSRLSLFALLGVLAGASPARSTGLDELAALSDQDIERVFAAGQATHLPDGAGQGRSLVATGMRGLNGLADLLWRGKNFDARSGHVVNNIAGLPMFNATASIETLGSALGRPLSAIPYAFRGGSALLGNTRFPEDGQLSIIVDYQISEVPGSQNLVDEIRQVLVGRYRELYLGRLLRLDESGNPHLTNYFALQFP